VRHKILFRNALKIKEYDVNDEGFFNKTNTLKFLKLSLRQNSIKCYQADRRIQVWKFFDVAGTDSVPLFRLCVMSWWNQNW